MSLRRPPAADCTAGLIDQTASLPTAHGSTHSGWNSCPHCGSGFTLLPSANSPSQMGQHCAASPPAPRCGTCSQGTLRWWRGGGQRRRGGGGRRRRPGVPRPVVAVARPVEVQADGNEADEDRHEEREAAPGEVAIVHVAVSQPRRLLRRHSARYMALAKLRSLSQTKSDEKSLHSSASRVVRHRVKKGLLGGVPGCGGIGGFLKAFF
jgi:hypothetical protein